MNGGEVIVTKNGKEVGRFIPRKAAVSYLTDSLTGILKESTVRMMESDSTPAQSPYGLGQVRLNQFNGGTWYGHQGRYGGLSSNVYYQKENGIAVVLILNGYDYRLENNVVLPAVSILGNMEALMTMAPGAKVTLVSPSALAFGEITIDEELLPAYSPLVIELELVEIK